VNESLTLLDSLFQASVVDPLAAVIFFDVAFWSDTVQVPLVVLWLVLGALFLTLRFQFVNFRAFRHALDCVRGRYTRTDETGEITKCIKTVIDPESETYELGGSGSGLLLSHKNRPKRKRPGRFPGKNRQAPASLLSRKS